jgi:hypothetical protein
MVSGQLVRGNVAGFRRLVRAENPPAGNYCLRIGPLASQRSTRFAIFSDDDSRCSYFLFS